MKTQLFLIHYAGGNCYSYQFLLPHLSAFDVHVIELPGRGKRMQESILDNFSMAIDDLYNCISAKRNGNPFIIYGHSMGSELGFVLTSRFEAAGNMPLHLIVSGNPGPGIRENKNRHKMEHDDFVMELKKLGGVPDEFFESSELFEFFEPVIRADFKIIETKDDITAIRIQTPVIALMGSEEEHHEHIDNWKNFTRGNFQSQLMEGDHFFIFKHPQKLKEVITSRTVAPKEIIL